MSEDGKFVNCSVKENGVKVLQNDVEVQKTQEVLNQYGILLAGAGVLSALVFHYLPKANKTLNFRSRVSDSQILQVEADKIWIEMDDIGKGIVESISSHNIRWLVMGAAANKHYSKYRQS